MEKRERQQTSLETKLNGKLRQLYGSLKTFLLIDLVEKRKRQKMVMMCLLLEKCGVLAGGKKSQVDVGEACPQPNPTGGADTNKSCLEQKEEEVRGGHDGEWEIDSSH